MNSVIWKYPLQVVDQQMIRMPEGAEILSVHLQDGVPCLWVAVDPTLASEERTIWIVGTGNPADDVANQKFIGTVVMDFLVWHVFRPFTLREGIERF